MRSTMSQWPKIRQVQPLSNKTIRPYNNVPALSWYEYSAAEKLLRVKWSGNDKVYEYPMSEDIYRGFEKASSKGAYLNKYKRLL